MGIKDFFLKGFKARIRDVAREAICVSERALGKNPYKADDMPEIRQDYSDRKKFAAVAFAIAKVGVPILIQIFLKDEARLVANAVVQEVFNEIQGKYQRIE